MVCRVHPIVVAAALLAFTGSVTAAGASPDSQPPPTTRPPVRSLPPQLDIGMIESLDECLDPIPTGGTSEPRDAPTAAAPNQRPDERFWNAVCERRLVTRELEDLLGLPPPDRGLADILRSGMCSSRFELPDRLSLAIDYQLRIRGDARGDPALGELWLDEGVLTVFEFQRLSDGTLLFDIDYNMDRINVLIDADMAFFTWFGENRASICADLTSPTSVR